MTKKFLITIKGESPRLLTAEQLRQIAFERNLTRRDPYVLYELRENGTVITRRVESWGSGIPYADILDHFEYRVETLKPEGGEPHE